MLTTIEAVRRALGLPERTTAIDGQQIFDLILVASEMIEKSLSRKIELQRRVEIFDGGTHALLLSAFPVESIESVTIEGTPWTAHRADPVSGMLFFDVKHGEWPFRRGSIEVDYTGGYECIPAPLMQAATMLVIALQKAQEHSGRTLTSERVYDHSVSYALPSAGASGLELLAPAVAAMISPYKGRM